MPLSITERTPTSREPSTRGSDLDLPPPEQLARGDFEMVVRRLADDLAFGSDASRLIGGGIEYAGSRPYVPGDPVRSIDWKRTARTGVAHIREYEALKRTTVHVVVDTSASMAVRSSARSKHDLAIWIASAVGLLALRRLSPVAIVGGGERRTPPHGTLSRGDLHSAIDPLRRHAFDEGTSLAERLDLAVTRAERSSVFIVLSDLHDPQCMPALRRASRNHDCAVVHLVDPAEASPLRAGFVRAREAETGETFLATGRRPLLELEAIRRELLRSGADVLRLSTDRPFIPPLRHFLAARGASRRGRG
ncbi:MAG: DUF58 domain-containing protein [Phycisphaerales bacterium]